MNKRANTDFPIHPLLTERWSPRAFNGQAVEKEKLQRLFEAARWAPSASNEQPWLFIIGLSGDETYQKIFSTLVEFNQLWTKTAPVLAVAIGRKSSVKTGKKNPWYGYDVGQSLAHLTFQAMHEGLYVHQMGGFEAEKISELFQIEDDFEALTVFTIGYPGDFKVLHPNLQKSELAERQRKSQVDFVFSDKFGQKTTIF
ncbi:MAG: nitroreductase family protein [Bacteroidales bacterium]|nr:nitroreductase family protein [Bacteroidales bacterium]